MGPHESGKSDNMAVLNICQSGYTSDMYLIILIRNIWLLTTIYYIQLIVIHIPGKENRIVHPCPNGKIANTVKNS